MNISNFNSIEITTITKALQFLQANLDQDLIAKFAEEGHDILANDFSLQQLEAKVERLNEDKPIQSLLKTSIQDWRLGQGYELHDLPIDQQGKYTLDVSYAPESGQLYFAVYNASFDRHDLSTTGLNGILEIRAGLPTISLGVHPDENVIHITSNTSNSLAVVPENSNDHGKWGPVDFVDRNFPGYVFESNDSEWFMETRTTLAHEALDGFDFGDRIVEDTTQSWEIGGAAGLDSPVWKKDIELFNGIETTVEVIFNKDGTHITSCKEITEPTTVI
ncbi:hypothetical protein [Moritella sp. F3]|uniref:hypothetical protein n=1 Tax=Moritella sp. F3 TaxID=2718882 RepID=UPI0018E1153F|nr:hypothetical protein [Moritella sp. F3]GIC77204.1 hypothetical protein FMO001_19310 [Moritella sp. F1]GIC82323.1 hypothetical protein FMO003_26040 [Moritella sp. F3]